MLGSKLVQVSFKKIVFDTESKVDLEYINDFNTNMVQLD